MTFKDLRKRVTLAETTQQQQQKIDVFEGWRTNPSEYGIILKSTSKQEDIRTNVEYRFNHIIGRPQKNGVDRPLYEYQWLIYDSLITHSEPNKHLWIKKGPQDLVYY